jgi:hypothetical protein
MRQNKTIIRIVTSGMLLLFMLVVTPKQLLHDWLAGHTHARSKTAASSSDADQISANAANTCDFNSMIATPVFTVTQQPSLLPEAAVQISTKSPLPVTAISKVDRCIPQRGPPSAV